jgi:hypothetical protein
MGSSRQTGNGVPRLRPSPLHRALKNALAFAKAFSHFGIHTIGLSQPSARLAVNAVRVAAVLPKNASIVSADRGSSADRPRS